VQAVAVSLCPPSVERFESRKELVKFMAHRNSPATWHTQNFLHHPGLVERLINLAGLGDRDVVLDLGAGRGIITERLARHCRRVIAVENDPGLADGLRRRFEARDNVNVRQDDALRMRLPREPYKVFASVPFDGTARLLSRLTSATYAPEESYLVVQREAAERVVGRPRQTLFSILRQPWFEAHIIHHFRRTDFQPPPRVDAVFLRLRKRGPPLVPRHQAGFYRDFVTTCFVGRPDLHLASTLTHVLGHRRLRRLVLDAGLSLQATPSTVDSATWLALFRAVADDMTVRQRVAGAALFRRPSA
jgi:23S rRNA (adenine-N6)-dimethyltransferase